MATNENITVQIRRYLQPVTYVFPNFATLWCHTLIIFQGIALELKKCPICISLLPTVSMNWMRQHLLVNDEGEGRAEGGGGGLNSLDNRERLQTDRFFSLLFPSVEKKRIKIKEENK